MSPHDPQNAIFTVGSLSRTTWPVATPRPLPLAGRHFNSGGMAQGTRFMSRAWRRRAGSTKRALRSRE